MLEEQTQTGGAAGDQAGGQYKQNNTQSVGGVTDEDHQNGQDLFEKGIHGMTPCNVLIEGMVAIRENAMDHMSYCEKLVSYYRSKAQKIAGIPIPAATGFL